MKSRTTTKHSSPRKRTVKAASSKQQAPAAPVVQGVIESKTVTPGQVRMLRAFAAFWAAIALLGLVWVLWFNLALPSIHTAHHDSRAALSAVIGVPAVFILVLSYAIFKSQVRQQYRLFVTFLGALVSLLVLAATIASLFIMILTGLVLFYGTRDITSRRS